jgi:8-oxo-dGTP pyrophosphatase MutT (NUDIX family)
MSGLSRRTLENGYTRDAAVLMLMFERNGGPCFLLTRRTENVPTHKGQISFPGGMQTAGETLEQTALRETFEEVGIDAGRIEVVGRFHDYLSVTLYRVSSFAAFIDEPFEIAPHSGEVAEVLYVPFSIFADPARLRVERRFRLGELMDIHFYSYGRHEIWGLTARIIRDFLHELGVIDVSGT